MEILKTLVGSRAHGLHDKDSDFDYRGVFVVPTRDLFKIHNKVKNTSWIEGKEDNTSWEIGHFLSMATKCNPTILEVFVSPIVECNQWGERLRKLFPYVWNVPDVCNAFIGYGINQRKKMLENKDSRSGKYACAYLRTLLCAVELLRTGNFSVDMSFHPSFEMLKIFKRGDFEPGEVINECLSLEKTIRKLESELPPKNTDLDAVNDFLVDVRRYFL